MLFLTFLLTLLLASSPPTAHATGSAIVTHYCPYTVYCAKVDGYTNGDPSLPSVQWSVLPSNTPLSWNFGETTPLLGVSIQCTRDPPASKSSVTQLEFSWDPNLDHRVWFDVSNVEGHPFVNEGFQMKVEAPKTDIFVTCMGASCPAGADDCQGVYDHAKDDQDSMRSCADWGNV